MASVCLPCNLRYWLICFLNYNSCPRDGGIRKTLQPLCHPSNEIVVQFSFHVGPEPRVSWVQSPSHCIMGVRSARRARLRAVVLWQYCTESVFNLVRWGVRMLLPLSLGWSWIPFCGPGNYSGLSWTSWSWCLVFTLPVKSVSKRHSSGGRQGRKGVATH